MEIFKKEVVAVKAIVWDHKTLEMTAREWFRSVLERLASNGASREEIEELNNRIKNKQALSVWIRSIRQQTESVIRWSMTEKVYKESRKHIAELKKGTIIHENRAGVSQKKRKSSKGGLKHMNWTPDTESILLDLDAKMLKRFPKHKVVDRMYLVAMEFAKATGHMISNRAAKARLKYIAEREAKRIADEAAAKVLETKRVEDEAFKKAALSKAQQESRNIITEPTPVSDINTAIYETNFLVRALAKELGVTTRKHNKPISLQELTLLNVTLKSINKAKSTLWTAILNLKLQTRGRSYQFKISCPQDDVLQDAIGDALSTIEDLGFGFDKSETPPILILDKPRDSTFWLNSRSVQIEIIESYLLDVAAHYNLKFTPKRR